MSTPFFSANDLDRLVKLALRTGSAAIYYIEGAMYYYDEDTVSSPIDQVREEPNSVIL